jgi:hypothetical protein
MSQGVGQGQCLPPLLPHSDEPWPSEGVLAYRLNATKGKERCDMSDVLYKTYKGQEYKAS